MEKLFYTDFYKTQQITAFGFLVFLLNYGNVLNLRDIWSVIGPVLEYKNMIWIYTYTNLLLNINDFEDSACITLETIIEIIININTYRIKSWSK